VVVWRALDEIVAQSGFSRVAGKQFDDLIGHLRLRHGPIFLGERVQCTGYHFLDVPGQRGMRLGGVQSPLDDVGAGRIKAQKPRLQAGRDEAFVEPEMIGSAPTAPSEATPDDPTEVAATPQTACPPR
jgi:hypothetical protein